MPANKAPVPCVVCNSADAGPGEYCDLHSDELHKLEHQYEGLFRLQRSSRGKDHETYNLFYQGECDPCGRILVTETDPENLSLTVLVSGDLEMGSPLQGYLELGIDKTLGDKLRERIQLEIVHSWYGNARACVDVFQMSEQEPVHWDLEPRDGGSEEQGFEGPRSGGGKHSIH